MQNEAYNLLIQKLTEFKQKYYLNKMVAGSIVSALYMLLSYLTISLVEHYGWFSSAMRGVLFWSFLLSNVGLIAWRVLIPYLKAKQVGTVLTDFEVASILGKHFPEVEDKLLNTLQLYQKVQTSDEEESSKKLILASIAQKTERLKPIPFVKAIDTTQNKKNARYLAFPILLLAGVFITAPSMLLESTNRIVNYGQEYEKPAPFKFILKNTSLTAFKEENITLNIQVEGEIIPNEVYIDINGVSFKMPKKSKTEFSYEIKNLQKNMEIRFHSGGYYSKNYFLEVIPKPTLQRFTIQVDYPTYLNKKNEVLENVGDVTLPVGTKVKWNIYTAHTDEVSFFIGGKSIVAKKESDFLFSYSKTVRDDEKYAIHIENVNYKNTDSIFYAINVIPDVSPSISVSEEKDSAKLKYLFFSGQISDDYGFSKLQFKFKYTKSEDTAKLRRPVSVRAMQLEPNKNLQKFYYFFDAYQLDIRAGDELEYYFEVWDNDGINGAKSTKSQRFAFKAPSLKELEKNTKETYKEIEQKMHSAVKQAAELQRDMEDAKKRILDKKGNLDYQDKKFMEEILKKQKQLEQSVQEIKELNKENIQQKEEFSPEEEKLLEKQQQIQQMFENLLDDKTKKMIEELKKLLDNNMKDEIQKQMEDMKFETKQVEKELKRMEEMFKKMALEEQLQKNIDNLDKLAEEQEKLSKEAEEKNADLEEIKRKQDILNQEMDKFNQEMEDLKKKNEELENKIEGLEEMKKQQESISQDMKDAKESLNKKDKKSAAKKQKKASEDMKKLSEKMKEKKEQQEQEQEEEDYYALRQILENLLYVSFEQEKIINDLKAKPNYSPEFIEIAQRQRKIKNDAKMIEDSLFALSKRVKEISSFVNKEIGEINFNMDKSIRLLSDRNTGQALVHQQFTMTSVNNLAVMLSEILQKMQESMQEKESQSESEKEGKKMCKTPKKKGKGKPSQGGKPKDKGKSMQSLRQMQEQLSKQIQQMKEGKGGQGQMSKELAKAAAQQESIRRELARLNQERNKAGKKPLGDLDAIQKEMDKTEEDLVNKRITDQTIKRQQDILVRMLESEKAEKKQDEEEKRESKTAEQLMKQNPFALAKSKFKKDKETDVLMSVPPGLNPYYRKKVKEYFELNR